MVGAFVFVADVILGSPFAGMAGAGAAAGRPIGD
jgi:hypothetical protein